MMKKNLFVIVVSLFLISQGAQAQQIDWVIYDTSNYTLNPTYPAVPIVADNAGNVYSSWLMQQGIVYGQQLFGTQVIAGTSSQGTPLYRHLLGNKVQVSDLEKTPGGELVVIGTFMDTLSWDTTMLFTVNNSTPYTRNAFIIYLDATGAVVRSRNLTLSYPDLEEPFQLAVDSNGNAWVAFYSWTTGYAIGLDATGQDSVVRNVSGASASLGDIEIDVHGSIYLSGGVGPGSFVFAGLPVNVPHNYSSYVTKVDASGNCSWFKTIRDVTFQDAKLSLSGNHLFFSRSLLDSVTIEGIHIDGPQWVYDVLTVKYDTAGNIIWAKDNPAQPSITGDLKVGKGNYIVADNSGGYYQLMDYRGQLDLGNLVVVGVPGTTTSRGATMVHYDGNGLPQYHLDVSGVNGLFSYAMAVSNDNEGYFSGIAIGGVQLGPSSIATPDPLDFLSWVARFSPTGTSIANPAAATRSIYPNPSSGQLACFTTPLEKGVVTIRDVQGRMIDAIAVSEKTECIAVDLPGGLYMVHVTAQSGSFTAKLIVR